MLICNRISFTVHSYYTGQTRTADQKKLPRQVKNHQSEWSSDEEVWSMKLLLAKTVGSSLCVYSVEWLNIALLRLGGIF